MRRLRALMRKEMTHMRHDPRTVMMILIMPILQLVLLGYAANTDVKNVTAVLYDQDQSQASRQLVDAFRNTGFFSIDYVAYSSDEVNRMIQSGQAAVGIIIPPDYSQNLLAGRSAQVGVLIDGSDPTVAAPALSAATLVGQSHGAELRLQELSKLGATGGGTQPVDVRTRVLYNPDLESSYNMVPGLIALILMMTTMTLTSASIVKEREQGTIEQLIVTPIRSWELVIAKITPYILVSMVDVFIILLVGTFWFGVPIRGSLLLLVALTGLYLLPNLGLGLVVSTIAKTQQQAQFMIMPIMLPTFLLSGFIFPISTLPIVLQGIARVLPVTYFLVIVRSIVIKGTGLDLLLPQVGALTLFSLLMIAIAALRFNKSLD
jgi:ABC-2 type transport system permease protein